MTREPPPDDDLDAREAARVRRRDHDAEAARRDLMRSGMGKVFKQITDSWRGRRPVIGITHESRLDTTPDDPAYSSVGTGVGRGE